MKLRNGKKLRSLAGKLGRGSVRAGRAAGRGAKELGGGFASGVAGSSKSTLTKRSAGRAVGRGVRGVGRGVFGDAKRVTGHDKTFEGGAFGFQPALDVFDVTGRKPVKIARKVRRVKRIKKKRRKFPKGSRVIIIR